MENVWIFAVVNSLVGNLACLQSDRLTHGNTRTKVFNDQLVNSIHPMHCNERDFSGLHIHSFAVDLDFCETSNKPFFTLSCFYFGIGGIVELVELVNSIHVGATERRDC